MKKLKELYEKNQAPNLKWARRIRFRMLVKGVVDGMGKYTHESPGRM